VPIAKPDHARTLRGVPVVIDVLANDDGSNLSIAGYTLPPAGTLALNPDQSFTYTPAAGFSGTDGFAYTVRDQLGGTAHGEVTIVVARPNSSPTATSDTTSAMAGGSVDVAVLANDNDGEGDPLDIIGVDAPAHGTISVQADQSIRYIPQPGFDGIDSFTYTVGDGAGAISTANVTVAVALPNAPPQARPDQATTIEGTAVTIDALANDDDPEGGPISLAGMTLPGHGGLTLTPDRRFVYTPDAGFVGPDSFTYTVKDEQGASSTGLVTVDVARQNSPPVATADNVTSAGQPVVINPLANDNDPDGDPLRLTALTLPIEGRIAPNPDGTVTYTPPAGFTGQDGFTYQVSDGTVVSEGQVTVSVTAPAVPTYANGFRHRRRIVVPAQATAPETADDFVLLVRESGNRLKPVAAGGRVQHPQAFDLRFELENGTKLDHEVERYDAATGSVIAWVRVPSWELSSQLRLVLYYGKPGLTVTEANPASVWRGYLAVLDARTGVDRSGANRGLAPTGIGTGALIGDAGAYNGSSVASRADAAFLSGLSAVTVQALVSPDAAMIGSSHGILAQGPMDGTDASAGLILQYLAQTGSGTANTIHFKVNCSDGAAFVISRAGTHRAKPQLLHGVWRQDESAQLYIDGRAVQPSAAASPRSGVTGMAAGGLYLGAGARDPVTGGWSGVIDEVRFAAAAFTPARIASEASNLGVTQALYGLGGEDEPGQIDAAPVAVPVAVAVTSGDSIDIDVATLAYDPDGPGLPKIVAAGAPANGVATVVNGKVRYTPFAGHVGPDQFTYTLDNAGKRSSSNVLVTVNQASSVRPKHPAAAVRTLRVPEDYGTFALAYAAAQSGDHISLANGTYAGSIALNRTFSSANPVVIRSRTTNGATFSGVITHSGSGHWLYEIRTTYNGATGDSDAAIRVNSSNLTVTRCRIDSPSGVYIPPSPIANINIGWNAFRGVNTKNSNEANYIFIEVNGTQPSSTSFLHDSAIYRNYFRDTWNGTNRGLHHICIGNSKPSSTSAGHLHDVFIEYNLIPADSNRNHSIYCKRACILQYNDLYQNNGNFGFRHGYGGKIYGNRSRGALVMVNDGRGPGEFQRHDIRGNVFTGGAQIALHAGSNNSGDSAAHQAASWALLVGNTADVDCGYVPSNHSLESNNGQSAKLHDVKIYANSGTVNTSTYSANIEPGGVTTYAGSGGYEVPSAVTLSVTDVGLETTNQAA
jgi:Bacterial Ig domain/Domain of unknown function (DUF2341)